MDLLAQLTQLYVSNQPVVSAYLDLRLAEAGANRDNYLLRWKHLRDELHLAKADGELLSRLDNELSPLRASAHTAAVLVSKDTVLHAGINQRIDCAFPGPLPYGAPILRWLQDRVPFVLTLVDRSRADLRVYDVDGRELRHDTVVGPDDEIERNAPGGWAQARYQRRAEDSWLHNAVAAAHAVTASSRKYRARLVGIAGDVRAVQLLTEHLPADIVDILHPIERGGGPAADGSDKIRSEALEGLVRETAQQDVLAGLRRLRDASAANATFGAQTTVEALTRGAVEILFVHDTVDDLRNAWFGEKATALSLTAEHAAPYSARLIDVLIRAALGTGANVIVLDEPLPESVDGVAALRRF